MVAVFWGTVAKLKPHEIGLLVSHGDPIAWLLNTLDPEQTEKPTSENLRYLHYPAKGDAAIITVDETNKVMSVVLIEQPEQEIY